MLYKMKRFESERYVLEFGGILEVKVTDKTIGKTGTGMGLFTTTMLDICNSRHPTRDIDKLIRQEWRRHEIEEEIAAVFNKGNAIREVYGVSGPKGRAGVYEMKDGSHTILVCDDDDKYFTVTFDKLKDAKEYADEWAGAMDG